MTASEQAGRVIGTGKTAQFHTIAPKAPAPPKILGDSGIAGPWTTLTRFAHASDLHITDTESPARPDFLTDHTDDPRYEQSFPTIRPQQLTSTHAAAATLRTIERMVRTERIDCAVLSGDLLDNGQFNELTRLLGLLQGGAVPTSVVAGRIGGGQSDQWIDSKLWRPADPTNYWTTEFGFPTGTAILEAISQPLEVPAFEVPTLLARGNHDGLVAGTVAWTPFLEQLSVGGAKPRALPRQLPPGPLKRLLSDDPDTVLAGDTIDVTPDVGRRPVHDDEFPLALHVELQHIHAKDYVVRLNTRVAFVVLDTLDHDGHPGGVVNEAQAAWLQDVLATLDADAQRPVAVLVSHHGLDHHHNTTPGNERLTGPEFVALLGRHRSVALWITGHTHIASTTLHQPDGHRGIWEITAPAIVDWPCQFQSIELLENAAGALMVAVSQHDYDATIPDSPDNLTEDLAGLHRLLAANQASFGRIFPGALLARS